MSGGCSNPGCNEVECTINRTMEGLAALFDATKSFTRSHGKLATEYVPEQITAFFGQRNLYTLAIQPGKPTPDFAIIFAFWVLTREVEDSAGRQFRLRTLDKKPDGIALGFGTNPIYDRGEKLGTSLPYPVGAIAVQHSSQRERLRTIWAAAQGKPISLVIDPLVSRASPCRELGRKNQYLSLAASQRYMLETNMPPWMIVEIIYRGLNRLAQAIT